MGDKNEESNNPPMEQPRQPKNLQGLLKFAMEATKTEDAPHQSNFQEMDPERKRFLEEALNSLTVDVVQELEKAISILTNQLSTDTDKLQSLEILTDYVENMDTANDFFKIGGFSILILSLESECSGIRSGTANLIAELSQNNPFCQQHLLEINVIPKLIALLSDDIPAVTVASMHAISCLIRNFAPGLEAFIDMGGLECVLGCLKNHHTKLSIKSCFLISALSSESESVKKQLIALNAIERLIEVIPGSVTGYDIHLETILSALVTLVDSSGPYERCRRSLSFHDTLENIIKNNINLVECEEIVNYCQNLINKCFDGKPDNADR